jgi:hypothetical protein
MLAIFKEGFENQNSRKKKRELTTVLDLLLDKMIPLWA